MKKSMQRILAIVLVAIIGVGIGVGAYFFLATEALAYKWENVPGAPAGVSQDRIIKIGVLDDMGYITGQGARNGAEMAAREINERGGVVVDGVNYYIGVETEDTEESNPALDLSRGVAAAERMVNYKKADFLLGGFRTEALQAYREVVMLAKKIFMITGSATAKFCQDVYNDYNKYKYTFRIQPLNEVFLAGEVIRMLAFTILDQKENFGRNITKIAIMRENLAWTQRMSTSINGLIPVVSYLVYGDFVSISVVEEIPYPQTAGPIDFYGYWSDIKASGAEITVPIISGPTGLYYSDVYGDTEQPSLSLGINVMGQQSIFWEQTGGNCEYEIAMTSFIRHAKTPYTVRFWDYYVGNYSTAPLYTATGAYDAVMTLATAIFTGQSLDTDDVIAELEESEFQGGAFTPRVAGVLYPDLGSPTATWGVWTDGTYPRDVDTSTPEIDYSRHDVVEGSEPFGHAVFVQWVDDPLNGGKWECVPLGALPGIGTIYPPLASWEPEMYSMDIVTANISWPVR
ncbi:MAG: ABC transporter substrate-binding protein [Candidatus Hodarchaeota archaeon]